MKSVYDKAEKEPVEIVRGKKNFYKIEREMPEPKKSEYNIKYTSEYLPVWAREEKAYIKKALI